LLIAVKKAIDENRRPGRILLSGSANFALLKDITESLAGRAIYLDMHPFTRRERLENLDQTPFLVDFYRSLELPARVSPAPPLTEEEIQDGGFPPVASDRAVDRNFWFLGYEQTYLERDLRSLSQVGDLVTFRNLMKIAALRTGQILNQSDLGRDAKLPFSTVSRYLGLLETSCLFSRLPPYLSSRSSRLIKSPKLFACDSGLACHLCDVEDLRPQSGERLRGVLFETYAYQNLAALVGNYLPNVRMGYWNVQGRHEVDFILYTSRKSIAIEVKSATRFNESDLSGLKAFARTTKSFQAGILAYNGTEAVSLGKQLFAIPLGLLLS
jgi:hypothetical protein